MTTKTKLTVYSAWPLDYPTMGTVAAAFGRKLAAISEHLFEVRVAPLSDAGLSPKGALDALRDGRIDGFVGTPFFGWTETLPSTSSSPFRLG